MLGLILIAAVVVAIVLATSSGSSKPKQRTAAVPAAPAGTVFTDAVPGIVDKPIAISVVNHNATKIPCTPTTPDGKRYTVYGSLVAPSSLLAQASRPVVMLVSGIIISGDHLWRMRPGGSTSYDDALYLAEKGQAVAVFNLLGYHDSVTASGPNGNQVCAAAESTVIHEVDQALRAGSYRYGTAATGPAFSRVAIMAFSIGGEYTTAEVYSFHDVDGLVIVGDSPPKQLLPMAAALQASGYPACKAQNEHKYLNGTGPPGYSMYSTAIAQNVLFYGPNATAVDHTELAQGAETSPCGILTSGLNELKADRAGLPTINIPILFAFGQHDGLVGTAGAEFEIKHILTGSKDRTMMLIPGAGHAWFVERNRQKYLDKVIGWLVARGL